MILKIIDNNNNILEKKIQLEDFDIENENNNNLESHPEIKIIIINNNNNEERIFEKSLSLCIIKLEEYRKKNIFGKINEESEISKIRITVNDNNQLYSNIFYYWQLLRFCSNSQDFFNALRNYFYDNKIILIEHNLDSTYEFKVDLSYIREYKIEIRKNQINYSEYTCCACCECKCYQNLYTFCLNKKYFCLCLCLYAIIRIFLKVLFYFCKLIIRILLQIGEIYFSLILLGFFLETTTILLTGSQVFMHGGWWVLEIYLFSYLAFFLNYQLVYPLVLQFWEALKFRYIKERNPFIIIVRSMKTNDFIGGENKLSENILDIICICTSVLYLISFLIYNSTPLLFEIINLFIFIIFPLIKSSIIYFYNWYIGLIIIKFRLSRNNNNINDENVRKLVNFDKFSQKLKSNEFNESYGELDPIRLRMYGEGLINFQSECFKWKFISSLFSFFLTILTYSLKFRSWKFPLYFLFFFIAIFPVSTAIPLDNCNENIKNLKI